MKRCPKCGGIYSNRDFKCINCEVSLVKSEFQPNSNASNSNRPKASIIQCHACLGNVSNQAKSCPHCGQPINTKTTCPKCGSQEIDDIGGFKKGASALAFGVFAANTVLNNYKCKKCGHKFK